MLKFLSYDQFNVQKHAWTPLEWMPISSPGSSDRTKIYHRKNKIIGTKLIHFPLYLIINKSNTNHLTNRWASITWTLSNQLLQFRCSARLWPRLRSRVAYIAKHTFLGVRHRMNTACISTTTQSPSILLSWYQAAATFPFQWFQFWNKRCHLYEF